MSRSARRLLVLLLGLLAPVAPAAAAEDADVRLLSGADEAAWVGQEVPVYLELWSSALSFSEQSFLVPKVSGAWFFQADSSTVKLTEQRNGTTWQGLRYTLSLYPQRAGVLTVPPFEVRFATRETFNAEPRQHRFTTAALDIEARLPPGVGEGSLLVTTGAFDVSATWEPRSAQQGEALELQTGDALVLTVRREADGVPGMAFAPLPAMDREGLGVYVDAPQVNDRVNRGDMTGSRVDRVTVVCERPGRYELPALAFEWWDPNSERLRREVVPALRLEVSENAAWGSAGEAGAEAVGGPAAWRALWVGAAGLLFLWPVAWASRFLYRRARQALSPRRLQPLNPR